MAKQFDRITEAHRAFILRQKVFFTASAAGEGRVNLSPKGLDTLRLLGANELAYLDLTGSGNETAAHLQATGRLTLMFCAFEGPPMILRLYGRGRVLRRGTSAYAGLIGRFEELPGARQIVALDIELVQTSCGYGVPLYEFKGDRPSLARWAESKGEEGLERYRREHNRESIDGLPTGLEAA
jgi:Pyridoxamine 5'-phosphate oxidase